MEDASSGKGEESGTQELRRGVASQPTGMVSVLTHWPGYNMFDISGWRIVVASEAVERELRALSPDHQAEFLRIGELLCSHGPQRIGMPYVRPLGDKLWEMRLRDASGIARAIYFSATGRRLVVLHAFDKKTQKTPKRSLQIAMKRMREFDE